LSHGKRLSASAGQEKLTNKENNDDESQLTTVVPTAPVNLDRSGILSAVAGIWRWKTEAKAVCNKD
jgi:hypothetical protein